MSEEIRPIIRTIKIEVMAGSPDSELIQALEILGQECKDANWKAASAWLAEKVK